MRTNDRSSNWWGDRSVPFMGEISPIGRSHLLVPRRTVARARARSSTGKRVTKEVLVIRTNPTRRDFAGFRAGGSVDASDRMSMMQISLPQEPRAYSPGDAGSNPVERSDDPRRASGVRRPAPPTI